MKKLIDWLFGWKEDKHHPKCNKDCPKGGTCPRLLCADFSGRLWVEDLFKCEYVQKQIKDLKKIIK